MARQVIEFWPHQLAAEPAIAECVHTDGCQATLTTEDGRTYTGSLIIRVDGRIADEHPVPV